MTKSPANKKLDRYGLHVRLGSDWQVGKIEDIQTRTWINELS